MPANMERLLVEGGFLGVGAKGKSKGNHPPAALQPNGAFGPGPCRVAQPARNPQSPSAAPGQPVLRRAAGQEAGAIRELPRSAGALARCPKELKGAVGCLSPGLLTS